MFQPTADVGVPEEPPRMLRAGSVVVPFDVMLKAVTVDVANVVGEAVAM